MIFVHRTSVLAPAGTNAGDIDVGTEVILNENGAPVNYLIVNQGIPENSSLYDASCEGTWLLRKDIRENGVWNSSNVNTLAGSTIMTTRAGYVDDFDVNVQEAIKTVKIPYCVGNGSSTVNSGANGLECKVFPLGSTEIGGVASAFPVDGAILSYFIGVPSGAPSEKRIAYYNAVARPWYTRGLNTVSNQIVFVISNGLISQVNANIEEGLRPTLILPYDFKFTDAEVVS